jgi:tight adherence protein C
MSIQFLTGALLIAAAIPLAWSSVSGRRTSVAVANLQRGIVTDANIRGAVLDKPATERLQPLIAALARHARRLSPSGVTGSIERRLAAAGKQGVWGVEQVLAAKLGLAIAGLLLGGMRIASAPSPLSFGVAAVAVVAGWFAPGVVLDGRADDRRKQVDLELPDVMDQVTIAVEAGLGFEAALARVAATGDTVLGTELARMLQDIQLGVPRTEAMDALTQRCDSRDLRHFAASIRQAERYGLPIANVLRIQASELREKRRQRAEEHAAKIPVKILFPLIFCILPVMFIVILGPAFIDIRRSLG